MLSTTTYLDHNASAPLLPEVRDAIVAALGLGRVHVCGQAMGGGVALALAARHPALVHKLVLVDALVGAVEPPESWVIFEFLRTMRNAITNATIAISANRRAMPLLRDRRLIDSGC